LGFSIGFDPDFLRGQGLKSPVSSAWRSMSSIHGR
jgi:hypothetical protein